MEIRGKVSNDNSTEKNICKRIKVKKRCVFVLMDFFMCMYICMHMYVCIHTFMYVCICKCMYMYIWSNSCIFTINMPSNSPHTALDVVRVSSSSRAQRPAGSLCLYFLLRSISIYTFK